MRRKYIRGSVTIEASFALSLFISGYIAVLSLVCIMRTESAVQYGINRTAEELSHYCYAADRLSLTEYAEKTGVSFGQLLSYELYGGTDDGETDTITSAIDMITGGRTVNGVIAAPVIRSVFARHVSGGMEETDKYLTRLAGITTEDIDFSYSDILSDGKTIEIVAVYKISPAVFGDLADGLVMKNTASTAAWRSEDNREDITEESKWLLPDFERGRAWVEEIKKENIKDAVKGGKGITLCKKGKYSSVYSLNVFRKSYSECINRNSTNPDDYILRENEVKKLLSGYAGKLLESIDQNSGRLQYESGIHVPDFEAEKTAELIIVLPEEAAQSEAMKAALDRTADDIHGESGVYVRFVYREKFLIKGKDTG